MINFDKNATTRCTKEIWDLMEIYSVNEYGNPSALYPLAEKSRMAIRESREIISDIINCDPNEIYFVSSGTQADNWIINSFGNNKDLLITSSIEHHAVLNTFNKYKNVVYLPVNSYGLIDNEELKFYLETAKFCSIMYVNNEIGCMQDISEIGHMCRLNKVPFHTDAVQAFGKTKIDVDGQCIDFLSCSAHKFHGPKGIGFIYIREKYKDKISPIFLGGQQQRGLIAGTENVPGIVGMAHAAKMAYDNLDNNQKYIHELYWYFKSQLKVKLPLIFFNGESTLENCLSVCFKQYKIKGEELLSFLAENDICVSSGSACNSSSKEPSHVLKAIGLTDDEANSTIRFSFDYENTHQEVNEVILALVTAVEILGGI